MNENFEAAKNEIQAILDIERTKFDVDVLDRLGNQTTKLVNNDDETFYIKGENRKYTIYFKEPIFVQSIFIYTEGYTCLLYTSDAADE